MPLPTYVDITMPGEILWQSEASQKVISRCQQTLTEINHRLLEKGSYGHQLLKLMPLDHNDGIVYDHFLPLPYSTFDSIFLVLY